MSKIQNNMNDKVKQRTIKHLKKIIASFAQSDFLSCFKSIDCIGSTENPDIVRIEFTPDLGGIGYFINLNLKDFKNSKTDLIVAYSTLQDIYFKRDCILEFEDVRTNAYKIEINLDGNIYRGLISRGCRRKLISGDYQKNPTWMNIMVSNVPSVSIKADKTNFSAN